MSTLTINTGTMFSGKSTLLIGQGEKHLKASQRVLYLKPSLDNRYSENEIVTHAGEKVRAVNVAVDTPLKEVVNPNEVDVVLIDEVQFFDKTIVDSVWWLLEKGVQVYASGLDMSFMGEGFETSMHLMAIADKVNKLKAVCEECGNDSVVTGKRVIDTEVVQLGSKETYAPLCRKCYMKLMKSRGGEDGGI